ncbi:MAG: SGNH/GDSL hydrolase family protein [Bacteroidales bacterium]|nr:SGNH/GDSL hydrolase family protein [Bacteroidales bacterium]
MKKITILFSLLLICSSALQAQKPNLEWKEASTLTLTGKLFPDTPNPYHRVDTVRFKGFTKVENSQIRNSSGIAVAFATDSPSIWVQSEYGEKGYQTGATGICARGYDLYIRKDGKWLYAASGVPSDEKLSLPYQLIRNLPEGRKECLMYLPNYSEEYSVKIGVPEGKTLEALPNPFRHRIAVFGSSYTHGSCTGRSGMAYTSQFARMTGFEMLNLGVGGNSRLQSYFADALAAADADAFLFDSFSNPYPKEIRERLFPFIEKIQAAHPGKPLIFQRTIRRENRNFNTGSERYESRRIEVADSMMAIACKKYKDVYYIYPNATSKYNDATIDGVHPSNYGYTLWMESILKPVKKILAKYNIK